MFNQSPNQILMKKIVLSAAISFILIQSNSFAQVNLNNILNSASNTTGQGLSEDKIVKGLKEALALGTKKSTENASKIDGYFKNPLIKIPFPKEAAEMEKTLKSLGMSKQVDTFIKTMNRAAEDAAVKATPIFINAITNMSITDGIKILRGGENAATLYLLNSTNTGLTKEFKPVIQKSLQKVEITKYWNPLVKRYNQVPMVKKMNPNLDDYVTNKAIEGLFKMIAQEENKIRKDPQARVTDLLKDVFGTK